MATAIFPHPNCSSCVLLRNEISMLSRWNWMSLWLWWSASRPGNEMWFNSFIRIRDLGAFSCHISSLTMWRHAAVTKTKLANVEKSERPGGYMNRDKPAVHLTASASCCSSARHHLTAKARDPEPEPPGWVLHQILIQKIRGGDNFGLAVLNHQNLQLPFQKHR